MLLLNATLTVRGGAAASHRGKGWETFTDEVIGVVNGKTDRVVFVLWGKEAQKKKTLIDLAFADGDGGLRPLRLAVVAPGRGH